MIDSNSPRAQRRVLATERRKKALQYRLAGATYEAIAAELGISRQAVAQLLDVALAETRKQISEGAEQLRAEEVRRLDAMLTALWEKAAKNGDEQSIDRVLRIMARRAALLGLDAPTKAEVKQTGDINAEIERYVAVLAGRGEGATTDPPEGRSELDADASADTASG